MEKLKQITQEQKEVFQFLNDLRDSGAANMFGAQPHISNEFGFDKHKAKNYLFEWMHNYNPNGYESLETI